MTPLTDEAPRIALCTPIPPTRSRYAESAFAGGWRG